jgi:predicted ABC-type ATPase
MLVIVRGLPGSGKTSLAKSMLTEFTDGGFLFEADQWFEKDGAYNYQQDKIQEAHDWCLAATIAHLVDNNTKPVFVANTFVLREHVKPYLQAARDFKHTVYVLEPLTSWVFNPEACSRFNQHGVPITTIQRMFQQWEPIKTGFHLPANLLANL